MKAIQCDYCADLICKGEPVFRCVHSDKSFNQTLLRSAHRLKSDGELNCEICAMRFGKEPANVYQVLGSDYDNLDWTDEKVLDDSYDKRKRIEGNNGQTIE